MTTILNNNFKFPSILKEMGRGAIMGSTAHILLARNGAILAMAVGMGAAALAIGTNTLAGAERRGLGGVVTTLGNDALSGIDNAAASTYNSTHSALLATFLLNSITNSSGIRESIHNTSLAINTASKIIFKSQIAKTIADTLDPISSGKAVMGTVLHSTLRTACEAVVKGALSGASSVILGRVVPKRLQANFFAQTIAGIALESFATIFASKILN
jgi:hypothetical protein